MYWYLNTQTETPLIFSSLTAIEKETGLSIDTLKYTFSRHKRTEYKKGDHWIVKVDVISSKRS